MTQSSTNADEQRGPLWSYFLSGPVIYALYFLAVYTLGEFGCFAGIQHLNWLGWDPIRIGVVALTVVAALVTLVLGLVSLRRWRALRAPPDSPEEGDPIFMLFIGVWLNWLFTALILLSAAPLLLGSACTWI